MVDNFRLSDLRRSPSRNRRLRTQVRIDAQLALIAALRPGSAQHKTATETLLLFQDSLHLIDETDRILAAARRTAP